LILGCGYTGTVVARRATAAGEHVVGTVRSEARVAPLTALGVEVLRFDRISQPEVEAVAERVSHGTHVLVTFPPDGATDAALASAVAHARSIVYLSTTGVFGVVHGVVDDDTPLAPASPRTRARVAAEEIWRATGATVLRCPAIYGPDRGLHVRIREGRHRIPGDGRAHVSRIHVEDLASFALAASSTTEARGRTYVVGDLEPAPHLDVVRFVCEREGLPLPPFAPLDEVDESLRGDRRVDARRAMAELGVELRFPSYREGLAPSSSATRS
jgi:nucleoside-diphosphate-sugar epimerase